MASKVKQWNQSVRVTGSPIRLSATPPTYDIRPPLLGLGGIKAEQVNEKALIAAEQIIAALTKEG